MLEGSAEAPLRAARGVRGLARPTATHAVVAGLVLVAVYAALMTLAAPAWVLTGWTALAAVMAVISLTGGLTVLAAIGPFTEALTDDGRITAVPFLLAALGLGVLVEAARLLMRRGLPRPTAVVLLAGLLFIVTLLGVGLSALSHGPQRGVEALQLWVPGIGGGLTVLVAAWLVGRVGEVRPLVVLLISITLAAGLTIADVLLNGVVRASPLEWLLRSDVGPGRLTGIIPAPNAAAAIFLVGLAGCAAFAIRGRPAQVRWMAVTAAAILLAGVFMTYSRSALLALAVMAAVLAWHWRGWRALAGVLAGGAAAVAVALAFPQLGLSREVPFWADEARLTAWGASFSMWVDQPLMGHGFRSFEWLHGVYGSSLDAPHNEWLRFFAEGGLAAGLIAIGTFAMAFIASLRRTSWPAIGAALSVAAFSVMASFNNPLLYVQFTAPLFLMIGYHGWSDPDDAATPRATFEHASTHGTPG